MVNIGTVPKRTRILATNNDGLSVKAIRLKTDAVALADSEGMANIYYWERGSFVFVQEH